MRLHVFPPSPNARKCMFANRELGLGIPETVVDLRAGDQHKPAFVALNPNAKMPVLEFDDGGSLWESNAITNRLAAGSALWPAGHAQHDVMRWQFWESCHFMPTASRFISRHFFGDESVDLDAASTEFHRLAAILDDHLSQRDWLVGQAMTTADISVSAVLCYRDACHMPAAGYRNLGAWLARIEAKPAWQEANRMPEAA